MALEDQLAELISVQKEILATLKAGTASTAAPAAAEKAPAKSRSKKTETKATPPADDLDDDLASGSGKNAGDDLDDDLGEGDDLDDLGADEVPAFTADDVRASLMKVKEVCGKDKALSIMKTQGKSASVAGVMPENYTATIHACTAALKAAK